MPLTAVSPEPKRGNDSLCITAPSTHCSDISLSHPKEKKSLPSPQPAAHRDHCLSEPEGGSTMGMETQRRQHSSLQFRGPGPGCRQSRGASGEVLPKPGQPRWAWEEPSQALRRTEFPGARVLSGKSGNAHSSRSRNFHSACGNEDVCKARAFQAEKAEL